MCIDFYEPGFIATMNYRCVAPFSTLFSIEQCRNYFIIFLLFFRYDANVLLYEVMRMIHDSFEINDEFAYFISTPFVTNEIPYLVSFITI
jgi:hypothetical protein